MEAQQKILVIRRLALAKYCEQVDSSLTALPPVTRATLERHLTELNIRISSVTEIHNTLTSLVKDEDLDDFICESENWLEQKMATLDRLNECLN